MIPAAHEAENLARLLPLVRATLDSLRIEHETLIVTRDADPGARELAAAAGARVLQQEQPGYGGALLHGFAAARGEYVLTMDADQSHPPAFIRTLWEARKSAEILIASRYIEGGSAEMPRLRYVLSRVLNTFFRRGLSLHLHDLSSGFRLYNASVLRGQTYAALDFDVLQRILVQAYAEGWKIREVPFAYEPRRHGTSHVRLLKFGRAYVRTFWELWKLRNSILAADYDDRAHDSPIWLQRYWQHHRHKHITELIAGEGAVLDVGCGSSRIIGALPPGSVAMDVLRRKLRHARKFGTWVVQASGFQLPVQDESFPCVLCSQVIATCPDGVVDGTVYFEIENGPANEAQQVVFRWHADGRNHLIRVPMLANPAWAGTVTAIRIDPINTSLERHQGDRVDVRDVRLVGNLSVLAR